MMLVATLAALLGVADQAAIALLNRAAYAHAPVPDERHL